jgi:hypothetical protein
VRNWPHKTHWYHGVNPFGPFCARELRKRCKKLVLTRITDRVDCERCKEKIERYQKLGLEY